MIANYDGCPKASRKLHYNYKFKNKKYYNKFIITYSNYLFLLHLLDVVIFVRFSVHKSSCFRTKRSLLREDSLKDEVDVVSL